MEPLGLSVEETAEQLNISPEELSRVIDGEARVTFDMAIGLNDLFGGGASTWHQLQTQYDEAQERNKNDVPAELGPLPIYEQQATRHLEHGRVVYKTYDAEVIAFRVVPSDTPRPSENAVHSHVEFRFVGEGPGAVQIQMIYQPSPTATPRLVADVLFKAYLEWDATSEEYIGHIDASEWNRESQKLYDGKETMYSLYAGLREQPPTPALDDEKPVESSPEYCAKVLREAEELLYKGTASVAASALTEV
jgi:addiction module HigA family antidote